MTAADIIAFLDPEEKKIVITHTYSIKLQEKLTKLLSRKKIPFKCITVYGWNLQLTSHSLTDLNPTIKERIGWNDPNLV